MIIIIEAFVFMDDDDDDETNFDDENTDVGKAVNQYDEDHGKRKLAVKERQTRGRVTTIHKKVYHVFDFLHGVIESEKRRFADQEHVEKWEQNKEEFKRSPWGPKYILRKNLTKEEKDELIQFFKDIVPQYSAIAKLIIRDVPNDNNDDKKLEEIDIFKAMGITKTYKKRGRPPKKTEQN